MGPNERRRAIMEVLCQRRFDTEANLAQEFGVSIRTIKYDIEELSRSYPIVTRCGKYGGVMVMDGYYLDKRYLKREQKALLIQLLGTLGNHDRAIMESILHEFSLEGWNDTSP